MNRFSRSHENPETSKGHEEEDYTDQKSEGRTNRVRPKTHGQLTLINLRVFRNLFWG
jgi:hypothetical protein